MRRQIVDVTCVVGVVIRCNASPNMNSPPLNSCGESSGCVVLRLKANVDVLDRQKFAG